MTTKESILTLESELYEMESRKDFLNEVLRYEITLPRYLADKYRLELNGLQFEIDHVEEILDTLTCKLVKDLRENGVTS